MRRVLFLIAFLLWVAATGWPQSAKVISENANLRGTPAASGKVVDTLPRATSVQVIKQAGSWFLVQAAEYVGWVHGNTIRLDAPLDISTADPSTLYSSPIAVPREPAPTPPVYVAPQRTAPARTPSSDRTYIRGPRGGCYYYGSSGRKVYVDRSLCN
ncbi:MAG: SH3 domain-containing protein [Acidobacteria bacterium]|nr:SH3 domain-containing protein [Acidobacteriota bacterium]